MVTSHISSGALRRMMVHGYRDVAGYRLTRSAFIARAVFVGALAATALSGSCVARLRLMQSAVAAGSAKVPARDR
jgi:hypothetical protein